MKPLEVRKALYEACHLARKIDKQKGLPEDYQTLDAYQKAKFTGPVFAYSGGEAAIDAGLIGVTDFGITVAFRGTDGGDDWLNDFKASLVPSPHSKGRVHQGFLGSVQNLEQSMIKKLTAQIFTQIVLDLSAKIHIIRGRAVGAEIHWIPGGKKWGIACSILSFQSFMGS